jgi:hypothetical protein
MSTNQIGALTTLIIFGVVYIGTPLWAERRGRNWKIWLFLAFVFPGISLIALFLLPNKKATLPLNKSAKQEKEKSVKFETFKSDAISNDKVQKQQLVKTTKGVDEVVTSEFNDDAMDNVLADFEGMLMSKSVLHGLGIKGLVGVRLKAEQYDDDGIESYKCWIIVESTAIKKLSADLNEKVSDAVQDFVRENDFASAMSEAGFDPDLFNWWPVRVENVGATIALQTAAVAKEGIKTVTATSSSKKSYTEEFKKEVVHTALTAGTSLSEIARMYEINLTLVRNWKAKYEAEILQEINGDDGNENGKEDDIPTPTAIWHIDRAKFVFSDPAEYRQWKKEKKVFFEFSPSGADDGGEAVFADADAATDDFEVTEDRGLVKITLEKDGPVISAWVGVLAETVEDLDQETLTDWSNDQGGWSCSSIYLGDFEASIVEDDGGDWRLVEADKHWDAEEVEGKYMEVIVTQSDDSEHIYWVNLESLPEDEDEYDWSIQAAVEHHNTLGLEQVSEDEASASEPFSRDESEFTFVNTDMVSSGGNTNSNENGTGVSESRVASVCQITFGILEDGEDRPAGFCGIDDFSKSTTVIGFQDQEGEWVGFAIDDGNGKFFIDNCDIGSLDGKSLRGALPSNAGELWNTIMLSSVDLEEIEEEGIKFKLFERDDNADDDLRPFHIKSALKGSARTPCHLVVHKTFGQFEFADVAKELFDVNSFFNGSLETPASLALESLGEISDFETDSETLCIVPLSKDRQPIEL